MTLSTTLVQNLSVSPVETASDLFTKVLKGICVVNPSEVNPTPKNIRLAVAQIDNELAVMDNALQNRFKFQNLSALQFDRRAELYRAGAIYENTLAGYPYLIDISFLSMTQPDSVFPTFGILTLDGPRFSITSKRGDGWLDTVYTTFSPNIPDDLKVYFQPTVKKLESRFSARETGRFGISAEYAGQMPQDLEDYINICLTSDHFESLWVIFEAPEWVINENIYVKKDPLIVGRRKSEKYPEAGWLYSFLGMFDPSPWEAVVSYNFVTNP